MAADITYNTSNPILYTPDYSFLRYTLDKKNNQYEQGMKSVSSAYQALNKEVTDPTNAKRRDDYLKNAQGELQKIASSDLSLQQNVNSANAIFEPMATNQAFLYDAYHTKRIKNELNRLDQWKTSDDPLEQKKYNPEIEQWVARDLESLRNGNGDINNYKVHNRSAFASIDPQDILTQAAKDYGFKFKVDDVGIPYITTTEGGKAGVPNYKTFAENVLKSNTAYTRQLEVLSQNSRESVLEKYKSNPLWSGVDPKLIYQDYAKSSYTVHRNNEEQYVKGLENDLTKADAEIKAQWNLNQEKYTKGKEDLTNGNENTDEARAFIAFRQKVATKNSLSDNVVSAKDDFANTYGDGTDKDENLQKYVNQFSSNPESFFYNQRFKNDITTFSNIKASSYERSTKENRGYVDLETARLNSLKLAASIENTLADNERADKALGLREAAAGTRKVKNANGTESTKEPEIVQLSASSTQLYTINALAKLKEDVNFATNSANNSMLSAGGAMYLLGEKGMGLSDQKLSLLKGAWKKKIENSDPTKEAQLTKEEKDAFNEAAIKMKEFAKNALGDKINEIFPDNKKLTINDLPSLLEHAITGYTPKDNLQSKAMLEFENYKTASKKVEERSQALKIGKDAVIKAKESDVLQELKSNPSLQLRYPGLDPKILNQIATDYINGTLKVDITHAKHVTADPLSGGGYMDEGWTTFTLNGKKYEIPDGSLFRLSPKEYKNLTKQINEEVPVPSWEPMQGMMMANPRYKLNGELKNTVIDDLSYGSQTNSEIWEYADGTSEAQSAEDQTLIRSALADGKNIASVDIFTASPLNNGKQVAAVTFNTSNNEKAPKYSGKTYYFPISVNTTSPKVFSIFEQANELGEFEKNKKEGIPYEINTFKSLGVRAVISPNMAGDNTGFVKIYTKPWNEKTKSYDDQEQPLGGDVEYQLNTQSFTEMKQNLFEKVIFPYVQNYMQYKNQKDNSKTTKPLTLNNILD